MNDLVYSTSASWPHTRGWDAFDRLVLWAVAARPAQCFDDVVQLVPDGVLFYLVRRSLQFLAGAGLVVRRRANSSAPGGVAVDRSVWEATPAGRALLGDAGELKAA